VNVHVASHYLRNDVRADVAHAVRRHIEHLHDLAALIRRGDAIPDGERANIAAALDVAARTMQRFEDCRRGAR
jgi:hypothetical protein